MAKLDLFKEVWELALEQYKNAKNFKAFVKAVISTGQGFEDALERLRNWANLDEASGKWLDLLGQILNVKRNPLESDEEYKARLKELSHVETAGTGNYVIEQARIISGDNSPTLFEEQPCIFFVYTPLGSELSREQVQRTAPVGVLGLSGVALQTTTGQFLTTAKGKKLLASNKRGG